MNISALPVALKLNIASFLEEEDQRDLSLTCHAQYEIVSFQAQHLIEQNNQFATISAIFQSLIEKLGVGIGDLQKMRSIYRVITGKEENESEYREWYDERTIEPFKGLSFYQWIIEKMYRHVSLGHLHLGQVLSVYANKESLDRNVFLQCTNTLELGSLNNFPLEEGKEFYLCLLEGNYRAIKNFYKGYQWELSDYSKDRFYERMLSGMMHRRDIAALENEIAEGHYQDKGYIYFLLARVYCAQGNIEKALALQPRINPERQNIFFQEICFGLFHAGRYEEIFIHYPPRGFSYELEGLVLKFCKKGYLDLALRVCKIQGQIIGRNCYFLIDYAPVLIKYFCKQDNFLEAMKLHALHQNRIDRFSKKIVKSLARKGYFGEAAYQIRKMERGYQRNQAISALMQIYSEDRSWVFNPADFTLFDSNRLLMICMRSLEENRLFAAYQILEIIDESESRDLQIIKERLMVEIKQYKHYRYYLLRNRIEFVFFRCIQFLRMTLGHIYFSLKVKAFQIGLVSL